MMTKVSESGSESMGSSISLPDEPPAGVPSSSLSSSPLPLSSLSLGSGAGFS